MKVGAGGPGSQGRVRSSGFRVLGSESGFQVPGSGYRDAGSGFRMSGFGDGGVEFRDSGAECWVLGRVFRDSRSAFRVGGFRVPRLLIGVPGCGLSGLM